MARKSDIRAAADKALQALIAAANTDDGKVADRHLNEALAKLCEASGRAPIGGGHKALREANRGNVRLGGDSGGLLERVGLDEEGMPLREARPPAQDGDELMGRLGLNREDYEGF